MGEITTLLIDDEIDALEILAWKIQKYCPNLKVIGQISDPREAIRAIDTVKPACIFLDIQMPTMSGFDLLDRLTYTKMSVVFVTAHDQYAIKAIKAKALHYILKPVSTEELLDTTKKLNEAHLLKFQQMHTQVQSIQSKIVLHINGSLLFFNSNEVIFLKAEGSYTKLYLTYGRTEILSKTLKEVSLSFENNHNFFRIHNSFFINLNHVKEYQKSYGGTVIMTNDESVNVSRSKKEEFLTRILAS